MDNVANQGQTQSVPQPIAAPQVMAPAAPMAMEATPQYVAPMQQQQTPAVQNKTLDFFKEINWLEVTFMFLGALALYKTVDYYSYKKKEDKTTYYDIQRQIDKLNQRATTNEGDTMQIISMMEGRGGSVAAIM